jgi:sugar phosphate isomerase/epimerase
MRFGFCSAFEHFPTIAAAGFDYFEPPLAAALKPEEPAATVMPRLLEVAERQKIQAEAFNVFLPGDLKITGPSVDPDRQRTYLESAFDRVRSLGGDTVVFGSAGARGVAEGFATAEASRQIIAFLKLAGSIAAENNLKIVVEPLNRGECNIINSVAEGLELVRAVNSSAVKVLSDLYHVDLEHQSYAETRDAGEHLYHVHVAGALGRRAPILADVDYLARFFAVLKAMGYSKRISVEGNTNDVARDAPVALDACRKAWAIA